jgi:hypothetical protein
VVADDFSDVFWFNALVKVVAWFDEYCWANGACTDASCSGDFADVFDAELFNRVLECF